MDVFITLITNALIIFFGYRKLKKVKSILVKLLYIALFIMHNCAFILNYLNNLKVQKDSYNFYLNALNASKITDLNFIGSQFMSVIVFPFVKLGISYFSISLIFSTLSLYAFYKYFNHFYKMYKNGNYYYFFFLMLIFLLPSLHYWTAGLTKEALIFYLMSTVYFQILKENTNNLIFIIALLLILLIRPYIFIIILISYIAFIMINTVKQNKYKIMLLLLSVSFSIIILKKFLKIDEFNIATIHNRFEHIIDYSSQNGASSIDLKNSNYISRFFLVLFRPLFYDAKDVFQLWISLENLINLLLAVIFSYSILLKNKIKGFFKDNLYVVLSTIFLVLFYSIYLYNLGLASRMRVMFIPYFYILFLTLFFNNKNYDEEKIN